LRYQEAVVARERDGDCGPIDVHGVAPRSSLEATPGQAPHLESVNILEPHQGLSSTLQVLHLGQAGLQRLETGPQGWGEGEAEGVIRGVLRGEERRAGADGADHIAAPDVFWCWSSKAIVKCDPTKE
jgi:hypothetical protein